MLPKMNIFQKLDRILTLSEGTHRRTTYMVDQLASLKLVELAAEAAIARANDNTEKLIAIVSSIQQQLQAAISSGGPIADIQAVADRLAAVSTNLDKESAKAEALEAAEAAANAPTGPTGVTGTDTSSTGASGVTGTDTGTTGPAGV